MTTFERGLFGEEVPVAGLPSPRAVALDLFDAAAERRALESGRPVSQERAELVAPDTALA